MNSKQRRTDYRKRLREAQKRLNALASEPLTMAELMMIDRLQHSVEIERRSRKVSR